MFSPNARPLLYNFELATCFPIETGEVVFPNSDKGRGLQIRTGEVFPSKIKFGEVFFNFGLTMFRAKGPNRFTKFFEDVTHYDVIETRY